MPGQKEHGFFRTYDLTQVQKQPKDPAAHQHEALGKLHEWFQSKPKPDNAGGILLLPTGGGKTFTAAHFLCTDPLPSGYKVLWLAHTHHLLEQAFFGLESEVKLIHQRNSSKQQLNVRVVSGTKGHFRPSHIESNDDVVIGTLQTVTRAQENKLPQLRAFLEAAGEKLFVVFDEAHHSPAPSYYRLIKNLREHHKQIYLLGLTATPIYTDKKKNGRLKELFTKGILYQVSPERLMADRILAKPIFDNPRTNFTPEFDETQYNKWIRDYQDIPESIITELAQNQYRNAVIAKTYADNKERYGKTIIFADRWFQCEQLREFLEQQVKGIKVGTVYSHVDAAPGSADARNKITKDENSRVLEAFRNDLLDVLINVRMLIEGTDVPNVNTVFLTRKTTSKILLTQMIGRALRGPKFGGTEQANIVSFVDDWQQAIKWAEYDPLEETPSIDEVIRVSERQQIQLISVELVRRLISQMDSGININPVPFITFMPIGWYRVEFETLIEESEDVEMVQRLIMVFENERDSYQRFIEYLKQIDLINFIEPSVKFETQQQQIEHWQKQFFGNFENHIGGDQLTNLFHIALHMAQNEKDPPDWFDFEQRDEHNLDKVAQNFMDERLSRGEEDDKLTEEYYREDRFWKTIYYSYELFKSQYNACVEWILAKKRQGKDINNSNPGFKDVPPPPVEPSQQDKRRVKKRDNYHCLCCGEDNKRRLVVDHINPKYFGGSNELYNLQTLCRICNQLKGIEIIDFRIHKTSLSSKAATFIDLDNLPVKEQVEQLDRSYVYLFYRRYINFFYRCAAVKSMEIGGTWANWLSWKISLHEGNNPRWLIPHLKKILRETRYIRSKAGLVGPNEILLTAPGFDVVVPIVG
jgi:superfamily II DNA or RNA helicase